MAFLQITLKYATTERTFKPLLCDDVDVTMRKNGRLLNGTAFSHLQARWREWDVVISSDELISRDANTFIRNFWKSKEAKWLKINSGSFIEVVIDGGAAPKELIEGSTALPEYKLRLIEVAGGVA
ncbi:MAG: hypothetical protein JNL32_16025 [Candidatus Kapabacteria bacterium]|nr:hypothetical protein [Candidatus Kapabacteria bacterium]